jgi:hypothetical protein
MLIPDIINLILLESLYILMALITSNQIRAARALIRISVEDLATKSGIGVATIKRVEATPGIPATHARTLDALERALIDFGIEFIGTPDDRPGVRLKNKLG